MKLKLSFIAVLFSVFLFFSCDAFLEWLNDGEEDTKNTCSHTWVWVVTTPATTQTEGVESERCSKCGALSGVTRAIPKKSGEGDSDNLIIQEGGYGFALTEFSISKSSATQYESFESTVTIGLKNIGSETFPGGERSVALVDKNGNVTIIGTAVNVNSTAPGGTSGSRFVGYEIPYYTALGQHSIRAIVRPTGGEWRFVTESTGNNVPTSLTFTVTPNSNIAVAPLIRTKWSQGAPYNDLFPYLPYHDKANSGNGRLVTDCGTTAMTMMMAFYQHPAHAVGESSVLGPHNITVPLVKFENYPFDWANMRNTYTSANPGTAQERKAVAELMFIFGVARSNGGFPKILVENFGYDRSIQRIGRRFFTDAEWESMIRKELDAGYPVYYYGNYPTDAESSDGYHAFIVDGYDNNGRFHANWGWAGSYDGWYLINEFDPTEPASFFGEFININIKPNEGSIGSNEFGITEFTASSTSVSQNQLFTVTPNITSFGFFPGGQAGIALVGNNDKIAAVIGSRTMGNNWQPGSRAVMEMSCFVPETVSPGQYRLMAVTRITDGEWKLVTLSDREAEIPNALNLTVTAGEANGGGYGLGLTSFTASSTSASRGGTFTATFGLKNMGTESFLGGQYGVALIDNSGNITMVNTVTINSVWAPGASASNITRTCTVLNTVSTGQYRLRIVVRPTDGEWRIATLASDGVPTSINFTVN